jgi:uncharacterized membrane-anchored protein
MDPSLTDKTPTARTWIVGALIVVAIFVIVFTLIARKGGSTNLTLPGAQIPASSMVAAARGCVVGILV